MAIGTKTDFVIYHEQFFGGVVEVLQQNADAFNERSRGAIRIVPRQHRGDYEQESFFTEIGNLITRRDITAVTAATDLALAQAEFVRVKLNRKIGPVANTLDAFRKISRSSDELSVAVGRQAGAGIMVDWLNSVVRAARAALDGVTAVEHTATAGTLDHSALVTGLSKFGDAANRIVAWIMHSKVYYDLVQQAITDNVFNVGSISILEGITPTLGRPTIITDSAALITTGSPDIYHTLGLVVDGAVAMESEERDIRSEIVTGLENLVLRIQGEYAFTVGVKGFQWDVAAGGANPTDAAVGTSTNWDKIATDNKSLAGVIIHTQ